MKRLIFNLLCCLALPIMAQTLYVSPEGMETNEGNQPEKPTTLTAAIKQLAPGSTLILHGGHYLLAERIDLEKNATAEQPIKIEAYKGEKPVLDAINLIKNSSSQAIRITGNYYMLKGIEIENAYVQGVLIQGSHNTFEQCVSHHNGGPGFGITLGHGDKTNPDGEKAAYNTFINCDTYSNFDWYKEKAGKKRAGTDADGFACSLSSGKGNNYHGCRSWNNSDDGWDLFESGFGVVIENCWTWHNGILSDFKEVYKHKTGAELTEDIFDGDGNGFKLGGNHSNGGNICTKKSSGTNVLRNSISFGNKGKGIDQNNHEDGAYVENCLSFDNSSNIRFWKPANKGKVFVFRNNIIFGKGTEESAVKMPCTSESNSWDSNFKASENDFVTLKTEDALAPRNSDGSLPHNFGQLKPTSKLINKGSKTGTIIDTGINLPPIPYKGKAPDVSPYELK